MKKLTCILMLSLALKGTAAHAGAGTSTADFLKLSPDSRSAALGNTGTADPDNGFAAFHNPALTAASSAKLRLSAGQTQGLLGAQVSHYAAAGRWEVSDGAWGVAGVASQWSTPSFDTTDNLGNATGRSSYKAQTIGASVSRSWGGLSAGAGVKKITQGFDGGVAAKGSALAWDGGVFARSAEGHWSAGAALTNAGSAAGLGGASDRLPTALQAGLEFKPGDGRFSYSVEAAHTNEKSLVVNAGMGFRPLPNLFLRGGYDGRTAGSGYAGLSTGVGITLGNLTLDYAFAPFGQLGNVQRVSVSWALGSGAAKTDRSEPARSGKDLPQTLPQRGMERGLLGAAVSTAMNSAHEIVVVDDETTVCEVLRHGLKQDNFRVTALTEPQEAAAAVAERKPCLVIVDMHMPGMNGLQVLKEIKTVAPEVPVVLLSGDASTEEKSEARRLGACECLSKPVDWRYLRNIANLSLFLKHTNQNERRVP